MYSCLIMRLIIISGIYHPNTLLTPRLISAHCIQWGQVKQWCVVCSKAETRMRCTEVTMPTLFPFHYNDFFYRLFKKHKISPLYSH